MSGPSDRYRKLARFAGVGEDGVAALGRSTAVVLGCGALGALAAEQLVRSGVGRVRIIDRDFVDWSNLQRQVLFTESDAAAGLPKAVAASESLRRINSSVTLEAEVADFSPNTVGRLLEGASVVVDGTDNLESRYLLNEACLDRDLPWAYGGCVGGSGMACLFTPGGPCLRCLFPEVPPAGEIATCDTSGVVASAAHAVASLQTSLAIRHLVGDGGPVAGRLAVLDVWGLSFRTVSVADSGPCPTCGDGERPYQTGAAGNRADVLCGRDSVQLSPAAGVPPPDMQALESRLSEGGEVTANPYLLRWMPVEGGLALTVFRDGRCLVHGTTDPAAARTFLARSVGG